jgi:hypothetical protein
VAAASANEHNASQVSLEAMSRVICEFVRTVSSALTIRAASFAALASVQMHKETTTMVSWSIHASYSHHLTIYLQPLTRNEPCLLFRLHFFYATSVSSTVAAVENFDILECLTNVQIVIVKKDVFLNNDSPATTHFSNSIHRRRKDDDKHRRCASITSV